MYPFHQSLRLFTGNQANKSVAVAAPPSEMFPIAKSIKMTIWPPGENGKAGRNHWI